MTWVYAYGKLLLLNFKILYLHGISQQDSGSLHLQSCSTYTLTARESTSQMFHWPRQAPYCVYKF